MWRASRPASSPATAAALPPIVNGATPWRPRATASSCWRDMRTVFDFATKRAELSPAAVAFVEQETGQQRTFAQFNARAERGVAALEAMGVAAGERVAILCHNSVAFFEVLFACGKVGAILVPLNWRQTPSE